METGQNPRNVKERSQKLHRVPIAETATRLERPERPTWTYDATARLAMTLEEWTNLPEDDEGELVDGYLVEEEGPDPAHEATVA